MISLTAVKALLPSLAVYGAAAGVTVVFFASEWKGKDLLQYVPIYNRKYFEEKDRDM